MIVFNTALSFVLLFIVHGVPTLFETESRLDLPGSDLSLKLSSILSGKRHVQNIKYPLYMMQLYHNLLMRNESKLSERANTSDYDIVLSLVAKNCTEVNNRLKLSFDMSSISSSNELQLAQLRIHIPSFLVLEDKTLDIYHSKKEKELFLGSFTIDPATLKGSSWASFDLTQMLQLFLQHVREKYADEHIKSKYITEKTMDTNMEFEPKYGRKQTTYIFSTERVVLVVFAKDKSYDSVVGSQSLIKTVESSKYVTLEKASRVSAIRRHRRNRNENHPMLINNVPSRPVEHGKPLCQRVDMFVDFGEIGWGDWIVFPKKYNAYRCEGACPIPLNETFKPTNHAYMKSVVKLYQPEKVDCPSCVPVRMSPLSMLYYEGSDVVLRHHEEMIVEECGCS
ncbi:nodal homolog [Aquarana catesbeiana]|uniref:nodal homolog n=1 Tax=Aquarana catesbeiana TaxID=8400 RepID=UPI003CCA110A